ncbi:MAG: hypothetical protein ACE5EY_02395 [Anaerolineae bacterium]
MRATAAAASSTIGISRRSRDRKIANALRLWKEAHAVLLEADGILCHSTYPLCRGKYGSKSRDVLAGAILYKTIKAMSRDILAQAVEQCASSLRKAGLDPDKEETDE